MTKWKEIQNKEEMLRGANVIDASTGNQVYDMENGEVTIDFSNGLSCSAKIVDWEIEIDPDAELYDPTK